MSLLDDVSLMITPNGVKANVLFGVLPTPTIGNELITNGDFATDSDWTKLNGSTISGGVGNVVANGALSSTGANWSLYQENVFTPSTTYKIKFRARQTSGVGSFQVAYSYAYIFNQVITSSFVDYSIDFTTNSSGWHYLSFGGGVIGNTFEVDNVSVNEYTSADMDFTRATTATKVNSAGLVASVATGVPRLDYTGGGCPHILAEPQRTNTLTYSQDIDNSDWAKSDVTVVANSTTSPDGTTNAEKVTKDGNSVNDRISQVVSGGVTSSSKYSVSAFVKNNDNATGAKTTLAAKVTSATLFRLTFEWTGNILAISTGHNSGTRTNEFCEDYGNGWYRIGFNYEADGTASTYRLDVDRTNASATTGIFVWGCQHEAGSYGTSYIPTVAASVTRNAETFTRTGIADLINDSEGVLYVEAKTTYDSSKSRRISLSDGTIGNRVSLEFDDSVENKIKAFISLNGTNQILEYTAPNLAQFNKIAIKYKVNDFAVWFNGTEVVTDTSGDVPTGMTRLGFDGGSGGDDFFGEVRNIQVYKTALSDTQLDDLTS